MAAGALILGLTPVHGESSDTGLRFVDVTSGSGIQYRNVCGARPGDKGWLMESMGAGAAWLDYDNDGNLDLYVVNGSTLERDAGEGEPNQLFRGDGRGHFKDVTQQARVGDRGWGHGVAVGDIDNDGDADIYVTNYGPNVLYRNNGDGTFDDITKAAGVGNELWSTSAAFFDMDGDGNLDLYVGNYMVGTPDKVPRRGSEEARKGNCHYRGLHVFCGPMGQVPFQNVLYRGSGDGKFRDVTRESGVWLEQPRYTLGVVTADYDNDGDQDIYAANDSVQNSLWRNNGDGTFADVGVPTMSALNADGKAQAGMGVNFGDYDADGWLDIIVTNFAHDLSTVYRNQLGKFFLDDSILSGLGVTRQTLSWGTAFHDFDCDGDLDLFIANGHVYPQVDDYALGTSFRQTNHLLVNEGGRFGDATAASGPGLAIARSYRGAAFGDYDNDGDMDVFATALDEEALLLRNDSPRRGHYLEIRLIGTDSNRDAVGTRVALTAGGRRQIRQRKGGGSYLSASDPRLHFGLGSSTTVDLVEIRWPGGKKAVVRDIPADRVITIREDRGVVE
ncbi:MAG: CRTAC1 family protein [Gemmatimonadetes bacterium]|nr:CRTAC1 family protein [Gemmatimonadota bacterium]